MDDMFNNIEPFDDLQLDCYQNLLATLLKHNGYDIKYLGSIWPWKFEIKNKLDEQNYGSEGDSDIRIRNFECIDAKVLSNLYGVQLNCFYPNDLDRLLHEVKEVTNQGKQAIVGVDQYHIHYHYPYIYQKQHGFHTVLITGYDNEKRELFCVDAIPKYKGAISETEFMLAATNWRSRPWYATLDFPEEVRTPEAHVVWNGFIKDLKEIKECYEGKSCNFGLKSAILYTPNMIDLLEGFSKIKDELSRKQKISKFCEGKWGWEVNRKGQWLIEYLKKAYDGRAPQHVETCSNKIIENNKDWMLAFRFLFMGTQNSLRKHTELSIDKLHKIKQNEIEIMNLILT